MGIGMLTAGIVLSIMVIPFISSVMRDVFDVVPPMFKESAYGLGATRLGSHAWGRAALYKTGVVGGIMLRLGRALGETMAVTFVIGNAHNSISPCSCRATALPLHWPMNSPRQLVICIPRL